MTRPPFDPKRAKGSLFEGSLFDPTPTTGPGSGATPPRAGAPDAKSGPGGAVPASGPPAISAPAASPGAAGTPAAPIAAATAATAAPARVSELSVSAFSELITRTLEDHMRGPFRIVGEIANLSRKGHWYFSIKDARAVLSCVMWQSDAARVAFTPKEGDAVVVTGKIGHYAPHGRTQLYATKIEPQGVGALELEFQRLVKELREKGYFADERKKPLPPHPRRVAVVTSRTGAALQDVLKTARERRAGVEFVVVDVRVQGEGAADEVARALRALDRRAAELELDAVIVTRGGGSREDLWAFNERVVAEAAHALRVPLVAAIGHEVDTSIVELVADRRASTPTQAVMLLLPDTTALVERTERAARDLRNAARWSLQSRRDEVARLDRRHAQASPAVRVARIRAEVSRAGMMLREALRTRVHVERGQLAALEARFAAQAPAARAAAARVAVAGLGPRLGRAIRTRVASARTEIVHLERRLRSAGPEETLARGYAIVTGTDGGILRSTADARVGERVEIMVSDGTLGARIETAARGDGAARGKDASKEKSSRGSSAERGGGDAGS